MGQRRRARECALQMLFQIDLAGVEPNDVYEQFWESHEVGENVRSFSEALVEGVYRGRVKLDQRISAAAERWRIERMAVVDRNVLRMAIYEMQEQPETPAAVVIDEAIEVARRFGSEQSATFVNGVLDAVRRAEGTKEAE